MKCDLFIFQIILSEFLSVDTKYLIVVAGPTAIGKTELAIKLAKELNTVVISADSRQFYKEMSIGTAKPHYTELQNVKHYFIDCISVKEELNAGTFEKQVLKLLDELFILHKQVILVGGSGMYINSIVNGVDELPEKNETIRSHLNKEYEERGLYFIQEKLKELDLEYYNQVDIQNPQRIIRAIEICLITGKKYSELRKNTHKNRPFVSIKMALNMERDKLYERINLRVDKMMNNGLLDEVIELLPYKNLNALNTVGYKELFDYIEGKLKLEEAVELIKKNSRNYAKRQLTWFRKDNEYMWFNPNQFEQIFNWIQIQIL
jgi:tRNA dimethylallyltransferase